MQQLFSLPQAQPNASASCASSCLMSSVFAGEYDRRGDSVDVLVGGLMISNSLFCLLVNVLFIRAIIRDKSLFQLNSYKLIVALGVSSITQLVAHISAGLFSIFQSTWSSGLNKAMGVLVMPSYVLYTVLAVVMALNRLVFILSPVLDAWLFSKRGLKIWLLGGFFIFLGFATALGSPYASLLYCPANWSWAYDAALPYSRLVQRLEMYIEVGAILAFGLIYILIFGLFFHKRTLVNKEKVLVKKGASKVCSSLTNVKLLVQAFCITACTALNLLWHNYQSFKPPNNRLPYMLLNLMWIGNSAVNPLVYFAANAAICRSVSMGAAAASSTAKGVSLSTNLATRPSSAQGKQPQGHAINVSTSMPNLKAVKAPGEGPLFHKKDVKNVMKQLHTDSTRKVLFLT